MDGRAYAYYALALLTLGNVLSYLDRNIIFALFEPIKADLDFSDAQLGWLGAAYAIVFSIGALFSGVLSDLSSRRAVLASGLAMWSVFTAMGGVVRNYGQMFATRALVGIGQSSYQPAAQAMLADYFPTRGRAQAMGIFWIGLALGGLLAIYMGAVLGAVFGWRVTLIAVGLPGLLFAVLVARLKDPVEPARIVARHPSPKFTVTVGGAMVAVRPLLVSIGLGAVVVGVLALLDVVSPEVEAATFGIIAGAGLVVTVAKWVYKILRQPHLFPSGRPADAIDEMLDAAHVVLRTPTLIWLFLAGALTSAAMNSLVAWSTSYLQRELDMTLVEAGRQIGPLGLLAGVLGSWSGGRFGDALMDRLPSGRVIAGSIGFIVGAPLCVSMFLVESRALFGLLFFVVVFLYMFYNGPVAAVLFDVVPRGIAATVMGAYVFFIHIAGDAIALPVIGALSDRVGLRAALLSLPLIGLVGGVVLLFAVFTVRRDMARVRERTGEEGGAEEAPA